MIDKAVNPFIQIAGARALAWGALGLLVSTVICYYAGYHYHGLLHFGPAPNPAWVVLCSRASDCVADTCFVVLFGRQGVLALPHSGNRCVGNRIVCRAAFARHDFNLSDASHADDGKHGYEYVSSGTIGTVFYLAGCDSVVVGHSVSVAHPCVVVQCSESVVQPEGVAFVGSGPCRHLGR